MIRITSKQDGFRRGGIAHSATPTQYPDDRFSKQELAVLQTEPMLVVELIVEAAPKDTRPNVPTSVAQVQAAATIEALDALAEGEDRKGVLDAIAKRRAELAPA